MEFVITRRFVGVGEASFISLAAPFIDDNAPQKQVSLCFFVLHFLTSYQPKCTISDSFHLFFVNGFSESCVAWTVLHVYTEWCCFGICLWRIRKYIQ